MREAIDRSAVTSQGLSAPLPVVKPQLLASTNKRIVGGLASLDTRLEGAGVLPKLEAPQLPEEITDDSGEMTEDVEDVRRSALPSVALCQLQEVMYIHVACTPAMS